MKPYVICHMCTTIDGRILGERAGHPGDPPRKAAAALRLKSYRRLPGGVSWFRYRVARRSGV